MLASPCLFGSFEGIQKQGFRLNSSSLPQIKSRQVVQTYHDFWMVQAQHLLSNRQRLVKKRLGFSVSSLVRVKLCDIIIRDCQQRMRETGQLLKGLECGAKKIFCLLMPAKCIVQQG